MLELSIHWSFYMWYLQWSKFCGKFCVLNESFCFIVTLHAKCPLKCLASVGKLCIDLYWKYESAKVEMFTASQTVDSHEQLCDKGFNTFAAGH